MLQVFQGNLIGTGEFDRAIQQIPLPVVMFVPDEYFLAEIKGILVVGGILPVKDMSLLVQETHRVGMPVFLDTQSQELTGYAAVSKSQLLKFPVDGESTNDRNRAGRVLLAALGVAGVSLAVEKAEEDIAGRGCIRGISCPSLSILC